MTPYTRNLGNRILIEKICTSECHTKKNFIDLSFKNIFLSLYTWTHAYYLTWDIVSNKLAFKSSKHLEYSEITLEAASFYGILRFVMWYL